MTLRVLIVGCGDIGLRIARLHRARGDSIIGVVRRSEPADMLRGFGVTPLIADLDRAWSVPLADALYWCAPPPAATLDDPRLVLVLRALPPPPHGFLYVSTTGVYGDCQGRWIDESEPLKPQSERGQRRLAAELQLRTWAARTGAKTVTLRVPGIYGPGRLPIERLKTGAPILKGEESPYSNRIHADDLARAAVVALAQGVAGAAYNASDGVPTTMADYFLQCAALLGLPAPPQLGMAEARARLTPALMSFMEESRRIGAQQLRALGWSPQHASLAEGLPHCI